MKKRGKKTGVRRKNKIGRFLPEMGENMIRSHIDVRCQKQSQKEKPRVSDKKNNRGNAYFNFNRRDKERGDKRRGKLDDLIIYCNQQSFLKLRAKNPREKGSRGTKIPLHISKKIANNNLKSLKLRPGAEKFTKTSV